MPKPEGLKLITLCAVMGAALAGAAIVAEPSAPPHDTAVAHETGVWQKHEYSFAFMGFTSTYSCDGLATKLQQMLITSGARQDARAVPGACASGLGRPDKFARADLTFYTLAAAGTGSSSDAAPVDSIWKSVAFSDHRPNYLRLGDCELVEQFRANVLPMFTTRGIEDHMTCVPHQESGSNIDLKFESLTVPPAPHPPKQG